jgi:hypothetical protein
MMADLLEQTTLEDLVPTPQPPGNWPNHTYPSRAHIRAFLQKGLHF